MCVNSARTVLRGAGDNWCMVEIWWHRRETRRQTEKTNFDLQHREKPAYSPAKNLTRTLTNALRCKLMLFDGLRESDRLWQKRFKAL